MEKRGYVIKLKNADVKTYYTTIYSFVKSNNLHIIILLNDEFKDVKEFINKDKIIVEKELNSYIDEIGIIEKDFLIPSDKTFLESLTKFRDFNK